VVGTSCTLDMLGLMLPRNKSVKVQDVNNSVDFLLRDQASRESLQLARQ